MTITMPIRHDSQFQSTPALLGLCLALAVAIAVASGKANTMFAL